MTLAQLIRKRRKQFYRQDWYLGEAFMGVRAGEPLTMPTSVGTEPNGLVVSAVDLAVLYLKHPQAPLWERFLWTSDFDALGQRIYVGGLGQSKKPGFQIHRHLEVRTPQWGWPVW